MADDAKPAKPTHLDPSELGTKQYWDTIYATELSNHAHNPREEGTVWFDDSNAEAKMVEFLDGLSDDTTTTTSEGTTPPKLSKSSTSILDLGCGNGSLLLALRAAGWQGRLLGVDYSSASVDLARRVAESRGSLEEEEDDDDDEDHEESQRRREEKIKRERKNEQEQENPEADQAAPSPPEFLVWDVLAGPMDALSATSPAGQATRPEPEHQGFDLVLDKGTFDAVSLSADLDSSGRRISEGYRDRVLRLLRPGGLFLVTSCNWTEAELGGWFARPGTGVSADRGEGEGGGKEGDAERLVEVGRIKYPSFSFGGVKGQTISSVCFMKTR